MGRWDGGDVSRIEALEAKVEAYDKAWEKDNVCGVCPYRRAVQDENERLRTALLTISQADCPDAPISRQTCAMVAQDALRVTG